MSRELELDYRRSVNDEIIVLRTLTLDIIPPFREVCMELYGDPVLLKDKSHKFFRENRLLGNKNDTLGIMHVTVYNNGTVILCYRNIEFQRDQFI